MHILHFFQAIIASVESFQHTLGLPRERLMSTPTFGCVRVSARIDTPEG